LGVTRKFVAPETVVHETLEVLIEQGLRYAILAPNQARVFATTPVIGIPLLMAYRFARPYKYLHRDKSGRSIAIFFYDGPVSRAIASNNY